MSIVAILFKLLANQAVLQQVFQLLAPILGELLGGAFSGTEVRPSEYLSQYNMAWIQTGLKKLVAPDLVVDGEYGEDTIAATRTFQTAHPPLKVDGVPGVQVVATIEAELEKLRDLEKTRSANP